LRLNLPLPEDCAQAQGATYRGRPVGSFGHAATFSFCNDKLISTMGEGGMLTTNLREVWERAAAFRDQGAKPQLSPQSSNGNGFRWIHDSIGTNWRMTEAQAAVGCIRLKKSSCWLDRRRVLSETLRDRLMRIPALRIPPMQSHIESAYYRFYAFVRPERLQQGWDRDNYSARYQSGMCVLFQRELW
jgi:dTDP-4-amino-4,6-dideoxygalactose transaminase